jgi:outer membrane protein OmpA-like peptidoglycan-associated protein
MLQMMPERCRYWIGVALALWTPCALATAAAPSEAAAPVSRAQQRELERAESLLREELKALPPNSGVAIVRDADRVTLRFATAWVFDADSSALKADAKTAVPVTAAVRLLKRRRGLTAQIAVFTDNLGGESANQSFSAARAKAVGGVFTAVGIPGSRIHQRGGGASDALSSNGTPEGRMENRRVEIAFSRAGR